MYWHKDSIRHSHYQLIHISLTSAWRPHTVPKFPTHSPRTCRPQQVIRLALFSHTPQSHWLSKIPTAKKWQHKAASPNILGVPPAPVNYSAPPRHQHSPILPTSIGHVKPESCGCSLTSAFHAIDSCMLGLHTQCNITRCHLRSCGWFCGKTCHAPR
jgi:hypothetical protein